MEWILIAPVVGFVALFALLTIFIAYRRAWRIPAPNEALLIAGKAKGQTTVTQTEISTDVVSAIAERRTEGLDFRIATAATWVNPVTSRVFRLPLDSRSTEFEVHCHDTQKIAITVRGVILYKVGDNYPAMAAAARRFLQMDQDELNRNIRDLVTGQVRALVGGMTIPELITDRQKLIDAVRDATHEDMARLGLQIDSLTIQDVSDPTGYIENLGRPQAEAVGQEASIAADGARQAKEQAKQSADLEIARVSRDTALKRAEFQAEQDKATEEASQAGPLARAKAASDVVAEETKVAELEAKMAEKRYDGEIRRRADAERYKAEQEAAGDKARRLAQAEAEADSARLRGEADAAATRARGDADASAIEARGVAEAEGIRARAEALATNGDAVIEQQIVTQMPEVARAFAEPLGAIDSMVVLDGAEGVSKGLVGAVAAAGNAVAGLRDLHRPERDGQTEATAAAAAPAAPVTAPTTAEEGPPDLGGAPPPPDPDAPRARRKPASASRRAGSSSFTVPKATDLSKEGATPFDGAGTEDADDDDRRLTDVLRSATGAGEIDELVDAVRSDPGMRRAARRLGASPQRDEIIDSLGLPRRAMPAVRFMLDSLTEDA